MSLPKLVTPIYELEIPSTGKKIKYSPFTVKEEKVLLFAMEANEESQMVNAIKQIITNCVHDKIKVDNLAIFDIEYIFLHIRARSVGEILKFSVLSPDDKETYISVEVNIDDIQVYFPEDHNKKINLNDEIFIEMKYPSLEYFIKNENKDPVETAALCIDKIYTKDDIWDCNIVEKSEIITFIESMTSTQFSKIEKFFDTMPSLKHTIDVTNPNTGKTNTVTIEGLSSFFA